MATAPLLHRAPGFVFTEPLEPRWHARLPELAAVANAVSLLMPHAEPYVVRSARAASELLADDVVHGAPGGLAERGRDYARQEAQHHREHRRFNAAVAARYRTRLLERAMAWTFRVLERRGGAAFGRAFAAGFETVAFAVARWVDARLLTLFDEVDGLPAAELFLWHLGEEAEHREVAFDLHLATGGSRARYVLGMAVSFTVLGWFTFLGTLVQLWRDRRLWRPLAWWRLLVWSLGFLFEALPLMAVTALRGHSPADLRAPDLLLARLAALDPAAG